MGNRIFDTIISYLLFILLNAAGIYLIVVDDAFADSKQQVVVVISYLYLYLNLAIAAFGYRFREIGDSMKLSPPIGKTITLSSAEIIGVRSILSYIYILKSNRRTYIIWSTLNVAGKTRLKGFMKKLNEMKQGKGISD